MLGAQKNAMSRSVYRYRIWQRFIFGFFGIFFTLGALATALDALIAPPSVRLQFLLILLLMAFPAAYLLGLTFRARLVIEGSRLAMRGAFLQRAIERSDIEGIRMIGARFGSYRKFVLKSGGRPISLHSGVKTDGNFQAWIEGIPDLNRRDRDALLERIRQHPGLGDTQEARLTALARAKQINIASMAVIAAAAVGFNLGSQKWIVFCGIVLAVAPFALAWLCWRRPLLYAMFRRKQDPRAEASHGLLISGFGLLFHMQEFNFLSLKPLLTGIVLMALTTFAVYYLPTLSSGGKRALLATLMVAVLYAYGAVTMSDACFDGSTGEHYSAAVLGGHVNHGRSTSYYLRLAPWGPVTGMGDVKVPSRLYHSTAPGDFVCLDLHPGWLHVPWFRVSACPGSRLR